MASGTIRAVAPKIVVERVEKSNSTAISSGSTKSFTITTTKSGYTALGIVGITGSGTTGLVVQEFYIENDANRAAVVYFRNASSSSITPSKIQMDILYILS